MTSYQRYGVGSVINAAGKMTALGGTAASEAVARAQAAAAREHVDLARLRARAGELVAEHCGAPAGTVTTGAAAGIVVSVAACLTGTDPDRVAALPDTDGWVNTVLLQAGHWVSAGGAPVEQMIRLGGGRPRRVGSDAGVTEAELRSALAEPVAALCFVLSHYVDQSTVVSLPRCIECCHEAGVPVVVDAAAEEDLRRYVALGADLVTYSGGKAAGGPTVGFVVGRPDLVAACELQNRGIARPMKVGKEQIAGLLTALEEYAHGDHAAEAERRTRVNATVAGAAREVPGLRVELRPDEAGRPIERVAVTAADGSFDTAGLVRFLERGEPSIRVRATRLREGVLLFDPREVSLDQAETIAARLRAFARSGGA